MNFLAHAYLSFRQPDIVVGNMISDFIKGKKKFDYPEAIQKGIQLHRDIDTFTDFHPATKRAMTIFRPAYRLYSAAFVDVSYDFFLANDKKIFPTEKDLYDFTQFVYTELDKHYDTLPLHFSAMLPYMKSNNWLYNYRTIEGIGKSFGGIVRRSAYLSESATAHYIFTTNIDFLQSCYDAFFPELLAYSKGEVEKLNV